MMQTRPGDIDPGIITYLQKERKMSVNQIDDLLNNRSGLLGIAGRGDMRDILFLAGEKVEDESYQPKGFDDCKQIDIDRAKLALKMFCYRVSKYIGAYNVILGGLDGLIFGGAIGSGSSILRRKISREISKTIKGVKITHLETNEELQIAKEIAHFLAK
jgi:acetate kinase